MLEMFLFAANLTHFFPSLLCSKDDDDEEGEDEDGEGGTEEGQGEPHMSGGDAVTAASVQPSAPAANELLP